MFVINGENSIQYVAADAEIVQIELLKLFSDIKTLQNVKLDEFESCYFAALIYLVFVKIHPFKDGNRGTA